MAGRLSTSAAVLATFSVVFLAGASARAQSPCADEYVMQPGDTLYQVTQQCQVRLSELVAANPQIDDVNNIAVGTRLNIPGATGGDGGSSGTARSQATHELAPGDTLFSLAERYGTSVDALLDANPDFDTDDLRIGLTIRIPAVAPDGDEPVAGEPTINVQPRAGGPGAPITVSGDNYTPGRSVQIGVGPPESEWRSLAQAQVQPDGEVEVQVRIPENADPGDEFVFVIHTRDGRTEVSQPVQVVERRDPDAPDDRAGMRTVEGRLARGAECLQLNTSEGRTYSLVGAGAQFQAGDYVRMTGETAEASFCMQGAATIEVESITRAEPPEHDSASLTRDYVLASWTAREPSCQSPDFVVSGNAAGGQVVETRVNGESRAGYVRLGDDPALIFDSPRREFPISARSPDALAVEPPRSGPLSISGVRIAGDGAVFIRCG
ncbi:LysM peptidoglycan-binding domain-containing protein [Chelativorans sp. AA-79]|uniref:LysM peptidoglycan-binding domain-containing protein n=1 Tax=Chelativorans sp. AA-79 TaxID=3028735 RepID=UPI0023F84163|nr:LysM peptidoglycan-binding domain-containing protein [Chelativorans sp. AA-79]WEX08652.1 LysM peptidoglycan-binding domain-containing protein [Chelativorans sp. AA-79]